MLRTTEIVAEFERRFADCDIRCEFDDVETCVIRVSTGIISVQVGDVRYDNVGTTREFPVHKRNSTEYLYAIVEYAVERIGKDVAHNIQSRFNSDTVPYISKN